MDAATWTVVRLTAELAALTTVLLLLLGTPLAWWLARTRSAAKPVLVALVAMPLVLPPSVIGFYLLLLMGPHGPVGQAMQALGLPLLPFTFPGVVIASVCYSLPFVVQPIQNAFEAIGERPLEANVRVHPSSPRKSSGRRGRCSTRKSFSSSRSKRSPGSRRRAISGRPARATSQRSVR